MRCGLLIFMLVLSACSQPQPEIARRVVCLDAAHNIEDLKEGIMQLSTDFNLFAIDQSKVSRDFYVSTVTGLEEGLGHESISIFIDDHNGESVLVVNNITLSSREAAVFTNLDNLPSEEFDQILELTLQEFGATFNLRSEELVSYGFCESKID